MSRGFWLLLLNFTICRVKCVMYSSSILIGRKNDDDNDVMECTSSYHHDMTIQSNIYSRLFLFSSENLIYLMPLHSTMNTLLHTKNGLFTTTTATVAKICVMVMWWLWCSFHFGVFVGGFGFVVWKVVLVHNYIFYELFFSSILNTVFV